MAVTVFNLARHSSNLRRRALFALAALALVLKILVPPGFMVAAPRGDLPFELVLCTAQGPLTADAAGRVARSHAPQSAHDTQDETPGDTPAHDAPCVFAGHGLGAPAPDLLTTTAVVFAFAPAAPQRPRFNLAPGRGLAAPPLPARGPPTRLI